MPSFVYLAPRCKGVEVYSCNDRQIRKYNTFFLELFCITSKHADVDYQFRHRDGYNGW